MCGISGFISTGSLEEARIHAECAQMNNTILHRGPDGDGVFAEPSAGLALGHRRLSILDLSPTGAQPMSSASGRFTIVYNGEIYSSPDMRADLEARGHRFRGHSDTEVLLEAVEAWGLREALDRSVGMFAFALWDAKERQLHLVRDRLGIKPLYYGWAGDRLVFGSELKVLTQAPGWDGSIDPDSIAAQLEYSYIPAPKTIYRNAFKLMPGTALTLHTGARPGDFSPWPKELGSHVELQPWTWWSAREVYRNGMAHPFQGTEEEALDEVDRVLRRAVKDRLLSDVPLGAFLSGGIDSSTVAALMRAESTGEVKTFSIGFHDETYDEAPHAKAVAEHLGCTHTELYVTPEDALALVPDLPALYDEPFSDSSQLPTTLLARMTREHVTVALSGDGGDEVFCGYNRYDLAPSIWNKTKRVPLAARRMAQRVMTGIPMWMWETAIATGKPVLPRRLTSRAPGVVIEKIAGVIGAESPDAIYLFLTQSWRDAQALVPGSKPVPTPMRSPELSLGGEDEVRRMMYGDLTAYLPDDILVKVDRATMSTSLEARVPLIDHRVVELAATLPVHWLNRDGESKRPLRQVLDRYVPRDLIDRPKQGFGIPLGDWLRGPLRDWAGDLLAPDRIRAQGFMDADRLDTIWKEHLSGTRDWRLRLWDVLMFQSWLDAQT